MSADSEILKLVERQMRNWEITRQQKPELPAGETEPEVRQFLTVSRAVGSAGTQVATAVAERLGWPIFDREILQHMAGDDHVRARLYEDMDERDTHWLASVLRVFFKGEHRREDYLPRLGETVLALARLGPAVFTGRGIDYLLPQDRGLRVRLLDSEENRIARLAHERQCNEETARQEIARIERERADYIRQFFGRAKADPTRFDLMINLARVSENDAVELIVTALQLRGVLVSG